MKKLRKLGIVFALIVALFVSCEPGVTNGTINFTVDPYAGATRYEVGISGIETRKFQDAPHTEVFSLPAGTYIIFTKAYDAAGNNIASCESAPITLSSGANINATAELKSRMATLDINVPVFENVNTYTIDVTGTTQRKITKTEDFMESYTLVPGQYTVTVNAISSDGTAIASFSKTVTLESKSYPLNVEFKEIKSMLEISVPEVTGAARYELKLGTETIENTKAFTHTFNLDKGSYNATSTAYDSENRVLGLGSTGNVSTDNNKTTKASITWNCEGTLKLDVPKYVDADTYAIIIDGTQQEGTSSEFKLDSGKHSIAVKALKGDVLLASYVNDNVFIQANETTCANVTFTEAKATITVNVPSATDADKYILKMNGSEDITEPKAFSHSYTVSNGSYKATAEAYKGDKLVAISTTEEIKVTGDQKVSKDLVWNYEGTVSITIPTFRNGETYKLYINNTSENVNTSVVQKKVNSGEASIKLEVYDNENDLIATSNTTSTFVEAGKTSNITPTLTEAKGTFTVNADVVANADHYEITVNGETKKSNTASFELVKGEYTATAIAYDKEDKIIAKGETAATKVVAKQPANADITWRYDGTLKLDIPEFSYTDGIVTYKLNNEPLTKTGIQNKTLKTGSYSFKAEAYDGNHLIATGECNVVIEIDGETTAAIVWKAETLYGNIIVDYTPLEGENITYEIYIDNVKQTDNATDIFKVEKGTHEVCVKAIQNNNEIASYCTRIDVKPWVNNKTGKITLQKAECKVTVSFDGFEDADRYEIQIEGQPTVTLTSSESLKHTFNLPTGQHIVNVHAYKDDIEIANTTSNSVTADPKKPADLKVILSQVAAKFVIDEINYAGATSYTFKIDDRTVNANTWMKIDEQKHNFQIAAYKGDVLIADSHVTSNINNASSIPFPAEFTSARADITIKPASYASKDATSYTVTVDDDYKVLDESAIAAGASFNVGRGKHQITIIATASDNTELAKWNSTTPKFTGGETYEVKQNEIAYTDIVGKITLNGKAFEKANELSNVSYKLNCAALSIDNKIVTANFNESYYLTPGIDYEFSVSVYSDNLEIANWSKTYTATTDRLTESIGTYNIVASRVQIDVPEFAGASSHKVFEDNVEIATDSTYRWLATSTKHTYKIEAYDTSSRLIADYSETVTTVAGDNKIAPTALNSVYGTVLVKPTAYTIANNNLEDDVKYVIEIDGKSVETSTPDKGVQFELERNKPYNVSVSAKAKDGITIATAKMEGVKIEGGEKNKLITINGYTPLFGYIEVEQASEIYKATKYALSFDDNTAEEFTSKFNKRQRVTPDTAHSVSLVVSDSEGEIANWNETITLKAGEFVKKTPALKHTVHYITANIKQSCTYATTYKLEGSEPIKNSMSGTLPLTDEYRVRTGTYTIKASAIASDGKVISEWSKTYTTQDTNSHKIFDIVMTPAYAKTTFTWSDFAGAVNYNIKATSGDTILAEKQYAKTGDYLWVPAGDCKLTVEALNADNKVISTSESTATLENGKDHNVNANLVSTTGSVKFIINRSQNKEDFGILDAYNLNLTLNDKPIEIAYNHSEDTYTAEEILKPGKYKAKLVFKNNENMQMGVWEQDINVTRGSSKILHPILEFTPDMKLQVNEYSLEPDLSITLNSNKWDIKGWILDNDASKTPNIIFDYDRNYKFNVSNLPLGEHTLTLIAEKTEGEKTKHYEISRTFIVSEPQPWFDINGESDQDGNVVFEVYARNTNLKDYTINWYCWDGTSTESDKKYELCAENTSKFILPDSKDPKYYNLKVTIEKGAFKIEKYNNQRIYTRRGEGKTLLDYSMLNQDYTHELKWLINGVPAKAKTNQIIAWYEMEPIQANPHEEVSSYKYLEQITPEMKPMARTNDGSTNIVLNKLQKDTYYDKVIVAVIAKTDENGNIVFNQYDHHIEHDGWTDFEVNIQMDITDMISQVTPTDIYYNYQAVKENYEIEGRTGTFAEANMGTLALAKQALTAEDQGIIEKGTFTFDLAYIATGLKDVEAVTPPEASSPVKMARNEPSEGGSGSDGNTPAPIKPQIAQDIKNDYGTYVIKEEAGKKYICFNNNDTETYEIKNDTIRMNNFDFVKITGDKPEQPALNHRGTWKLPKQAVLGENVLDEVARQWLDPMIKNNLGFTDFNKLIVFEGNDGVKADIDLKFTDTIVEVCASMDVGAGFVDDRIQLGKPFTFMDRVRTPYTLEDDMDIEVFGTQLPMKFRVSEDGSVMIVTAVMQVGPGQGVLFTFPLVRNNAGFTTPEMTNHFPATKDFILQDNIEVINDIVNECQIDNDLSRLLTIPINIEGTYNNAKTTTTKTVILNGIWTLEVPEGQAVEITEYPTEISFLIGQGFSIDGGFIRDINNNSSGPSGSTMPPQYKLHFKNYDAELQYTNIRIEIPESESTEDPSTPVLANSITVDIRIAQDGGYIYEYKDLKFVRKDEKPGTLLTNLVKSAVGGVDFKLTFGSDGKLSAFIPGPNFSIDVGSYNVDSTKNTITMGVDAFSLAGIANESNSNIAYLTLGYDSSTNSITLLENRKNGNNKKFGVTLK